MKIDLQLNLKTQIQKLVFLHLDMDVEDLVSNLMIRLSIGTNIPPPPTPPTLQKTAPKTPTIDHTIILHPNFIA